MKKTLAELCTKDGVVDFKLYCKFRMLRKLAEKAKPQDRLPLAKMRPEPAK